METLFLFKITRLAQFCEQGTTPLCSSTVARRLMLLFVTGSYSCLYFTHNLLTICVHIRAFTATNCFFLDNTIYMCIVYGRFYHCKPINAQTYGSLRN